MEPSPAAAQFARLVRIMAALRSPDGCPWDREQTLQSLAQFVLEEAYEVVDAIERDDLDSLREEIGDHIFEGVFLAQIASDRGAFDVGDALRGVCDKLIRRHPHVFQEDGVLHDAESKLRAPSADRALARWDAQKAQERAAAGQPASALGSLPTGMPALLAAYKLGKRAATTGFDWTSADDVFDKLAEETLELRETLQSDPSNLDRAEEELGDLLLAVSSLARKLGIEPEAALRKANEKFRARFTAMESAVTAAGRHLADMSPEELEAEWQAAKDRHESSF